MTANNGWPGKPGVPLNPEEPRWHWVRRIENNRPFPLEWTNDWNGGRDFCWAIMGSGEPEDVAKNICYLGPVLTPDQATALQKKGCVRDQKTTQYCADVVDRDKRIAELEAALKPLSCSCTGFCGVMGWLPADNDACARRQGRAALEGKKDE